MEKNTENYQFNFSIDKWEIKYNPSINKDDIFYDIDISSEISKKKWKVNKFSNEFKLLIENLNTICLNLPPIPKFPNLKEENSFNINNYYEIFENYIKSILFRPDVFNSSYFQNFFELNNHFDKSSNFFPNVKYIFKDFKYEISKILFYEEKNILFISSSKKYNKNFFEKSVVFNKISNFLSKNKKSELKIFKINPNFIIEEEKQILLYNTEFNNEISNMLLITNSKIPYLILSYFEGILEIFDISGIKNFQTSFSEYLKSINLIKISNNRIINVGININTNFIYSASYNENEIYVSFLETKNKVLKKIIVSESSLCGFSYNFNDKKYLNIFISLDIKGRLFIGQILANNNFIKLHFVLLNQLTNVSFFSVDFENNKIFIGDSLGNFDMLKFIIFPLTEENLSKKIEINLPDEYLTQEEKNSCNVRYLIEREFSTELKKEKDAIKKIQNSFSNSFMIRDALFNNKKNEIIIALNNGTIQIFSHFKDFPENVIYKNNNYINCILFTKFNCLFVGGFEKEVLGYNLPGYYLSEMTRKFQEVNLFNLIKNPKPMFNWLDKDFPSLTFEIVNKNKITFKNNNEINKILMEKNDNI